MQFDNLRSLFPYRDPIWLVHVVTLLRDSTSALRLGFAECKRKEQIKCQLKEQEMRTGSAFSHVMPSSIIHFLNK